MMIKQKEVDAISFVNLIIHPGLISVMPMNSDNALW